KDAKETGGGHTFVGVAGNREGMPRGFTFAHGGATSAVVPHGIPHVDGQPSMVGFGALLADDRGTVYAGERDRIGRLVRYSPESAAKPNPAPRKRPPLPAPETDSLLGQGPPPPLRCFVVFAPEGTTTDGSGYTAIAVGPDGKVYVGAT